MESHVLLVLVGKFIILQLVNVNVQLVKFIMDIFVLLTVLQDNFIMIELKIVHVLLVKTGMEEYAFIVMVVKVIIKF
jgi:hypothetical protein